MSNTLNIVNLPNTAGYTFAIDAANNLYIAQKNNINYLSGTSIDAFSRISQQIKQISSFNQLSSYVNNTLYITAQGEARYYIDESQQEYINLSYEIIDDLSIDITNETAVPAAIAVKSYVNTELTNKVQVDVVSAFPETGTYNTIYVTNDGEVKYYQNDQAGYIDLSYEIVDDLSITLTGENLVPEANAVKSYVSSEIENASQLEIVPAFPTTGKTDAIYINSNTSEAKYFNNNVWNNLSIKVVTNMSRPGTNQAVPTTKAVATFVDNSMIAVIDDLTIDATNENVPTSKAVINYVDNKINGINEIDDVSTNVSLIPESNINYEFTQPVQTLQLLLNSDLFNVTITFTAAAGMTYTVQTGMNYKINKPFNFMDNTSYIICINNGLIVWSSIMDY